MTLKENNYPRNIYRVLQDYFRVREVILQEGVFTRCRAQTWGCPEGSVLGPTIWNLVFNDLLRDIKTNTEGSPTAYADDLAIVIGGANRLEIQAKARSCVSRTQGWCGKHKLYISAQKSCFIQLKGTFKQDDTPDIRLEDGTAIKMVQTATYLGVEIDKGARFHTHCVNVGGKAKKSFQKFKSIAKSKWGLEHESLLAIYQSIFVPTIMYGAGAWAAYATLQDVRKLTMAQRAALLTVTGAYRTVSEPALLVIANVRTIK